MQLSPARGRLRQVLRSRFRHAGCSLAPRGDGYGSSFGMLPHRTSMQLIPARGRLPNVSRVQDTVIVDAAYPREGTVTSSSVICCISAPDAAYPREGTVTATPYSACSTIVMQLIPARGRLQLTQSEMDAETDAAYPREGTVTVKVRPR